MTPPLSGQKRRFSTLPRENALEHVGNGARSARYWSTGGSGFIERRQGKQRRFTLIILSIVASRT